MTLTSTDARAINPTGGQAPCRAAWWGLVRDLDANRLALEVRPHGGIGAGYAPSLRVESVVDSDTVVVEADAFSDDDLSRFAASDAVACIPLGDWSSRNHRIISAINTGTREVSFTVGHGLAAGDIIRPDDYDTATGSRAALGGFAFSPTIPTRSGRQRHGAGHRIARSRAASTERRHDAGSPVHSYFSPLGFQHRDNPATGLRTNTMTPSAHPNVTPLLCRQ